MGSSPAGYFHISRSTKKRLNSLLLFAGDIGLQGPPGPPGPPGITYHLKGTEDLPPNLTDLEGTLIFNNNPIDRTCDSNLQVL